MHSCENEHLSTATVDADALTFDKSIGGIGASDHGWEAAFAGDDGRVARKAPVVGDYCADQVEHRVERFTGGLGHEDIALFERQ